jgi:hypothetical protein
MARTATQFLAPAYLPSTTATQFTTPTGPVSVIRHIHVQNNDSSARTFTLCQGADAAANRMFDAYSVAANGTYDWYGYWVVPSNTIISGFASVASHVVCEVSGDTLAAG